MMPSARQSLDQLTQEELFRRISEICAAVNAVITAKELLEISLRLTMNLLGAQRGSIFLLSENGKDLILKIALGMAGADEEKMVKRLGEGVVGQVGESKQPIVVDDIAQDARFKNYKPRGSYQTPSFICAPLLVKDQLIGVINIADKESGARFSRHELQLLDFLSSQIALNHRRIQLYHKFKTIVKESQSLKNELGKSSQEAHHLKKQVILHEKLATIGKLAGGIAHEFNNPLDGVMRYTNLCLEHEKDNDVVRGYLLEIKHGLNRMANIVKSLLACSRQSPLTQQKIDVNNTVEQAVQSLQAELMHKRITVDKSLMRNPTVLTDYGLERVISNLLRNAIDAVNERGTIHIRTFGNESQTVIEVQDNGCGILEESMDRIFDPFYTTKDIDKGCGLGLTIVSEVVKSYNGQIHVDSVPQQGTTFTITIPLEN